MGLFGGKKTYVSSTVYNLAGDEKDRPDFLKTLVVGNALSRSPKTVGDTIKDGYLSGPAIKMRNYYRWAQGDYADLFGLTTGGLMGNVSLSPSGVAAQIPHAAGETVTVQKVQTGAADLEFWVEQWILEHEPATLETDWTADIDDAGVVTITRADESTVTFTPSDFDRTATYVLAIYLLTPPGGDVTTAELRVFIYKVGSGNATLDAMVADAGDDEAYFPPIAVRVNNQFLSDSYFPDEYALSKKAYRRLTGGSYDKLIDKLADNDKLSEIDYVFAVPGVSLNVLENKCRQYIYNFLQHCMEAANVGSTDHAAWQSAQDAAVAAQNDWNAWAAAQSDPGDPLYGTAEPTLLPYPDMPANEIRVAMDGNVHVGYDMRISWTSIDEATGTGLAKPEAKFGEVWFGDVTTASTPGSVYGGALGAALELANPGVETVELTWQVDLNHWKKLTIVGLTHKNYVYKGKFVEIKAGEALADADESGFIIPIHFDIWRGTSLVDTTQMATACMFLVINSYKVVKKKWYQTGIFKIVLFVVIIVVTVYTGGATSGLLGSSAAIGASLGFAGTMALIVGAIANALAAMVLFQVVDYALVQVFGAKIAAIIEMVATVVIIANGGLDFSKGFHAHFEQLMKVENLIKITDAVAGGVSRVIAAGVQETLQKTQDVLEQYNTAAKQIQDKYMELNGVFQGGIDPMFLMDAASSSIETADTFLGRTLMTGSDIAELTNTLVTNFSDLTLATRLPL
jgi:hypothetical protein